MKKNKRSDQLRRNIDGEGYDDGKEMISKKYFSQRKKRYTIYNYSNSPESESEKYLPNDDFGEHYFDTLKQQTQTRERLNEGTEEEPNDYVHNKDDSENEEEEIKSAVDQEPDRNIPYEDQNKEEDDDIEKKEDGNSSDIEKRHEEIKQEFDNGVQRRIEEQSKEEEELNIMIAEHKKKLGKDFELDFMGEDVDISQWTSLDDAEADDILTEKNKKD